MYLTLIRKYYYPEAALGTLSVDGLLECFTLEDVEREVKVPGKTAIPIGVYKVIVDWSNRFQRDMPHVLDVPNFTGIRIHSGNTSADTDGCIIVGTERREDIVLRSRLAFSKLFNKINSACGMSEPVWLEIRREKNDHIR